VGTQKSERKLKSFFLSSSAAETQRQWVVRNSNSKVWANGKFDSSEISIFEKLKNIEVENSITFTALFLPDFSMTLLDWILN
jgi:hypothetical protein